MTEDLGPINKRRLQLKAIADAQHGYFTVTQLAKIGYGHNNHAYYLNNGQWLKVCRGVYRLPGYADSPEAVCTYWSLWSRNQHDQPQVVISHETALALHGLADFDPAAVHLTASPAFRKIPPPGGIMHKATLNLSALESRDSFLLTRPARTLADLRPAGLEIEAWSGLVVRALAAGRLTADEARALGHESACHFQPDPRPAGGAGATPEIEPLAVDPAAARTESELLAPLAEGAWKMIFGRTVPDRRAAQAGFTLVELLVVVAIISILAGMLLPALEKAASSAKAVYCLNNQKQTGIGVMMYADSFNDFGPSNRAWEADPKCTIWRCWPDALMNTGSLDNVATQLNASWAPFSSLPSTVCFQCPSIAPPTVSYTINSVTLAAGQNSSALSFGLRDLAYPKMPTEVISPSGYLPKMSTLDTHLPFLGDSLKTTLGGRQGSWLVYNFNLSNWGTGWPTEFHGVIHRRHEDRANLWFPDGSARGMVGPEIAKLCSITTIQSYP